MNGRIRAARTMPRSVVLEVACSTAKDSPTGAIAVPSNDSARAPKRRRKAANANGLS